MSKAERRANQLGISHSAASARLRKMLLFKYMVKAGDNVCHVCRGKITDIDTLSIEHIKPWENRDPDLFWDLDNIAFSHMLCNKPHTYRTREVLENKYYCNSCGGWKPKEQFHKNNSRASGLASHCKACRLSKDTRINHRKMEEALNEGSS